MSIATLSFPITQGAAVNIGSDPQYPAAAAGHDGQPTGITSFATTFSGQALRPPTSYCAPGK
jgi:hypothetical protein